ncbi:acetolactate synthase large subunit [Methanobrevibacter olleyae]|uniref:Acetolactate synthase n=1 Tax=Methanobrevibacter olleyae TaxID=294671 RepID=A0A126R2H9_METOL|nr:acetolactate synthase large subunit [Methanobrevibacter olleyae]AMK16258.1 acetolactate synthase large subunit IlvB [Methanobrevibacter olleyae]SFL64243.1 acetolactate synthase, large subunit [Methanobrevibacter olleyae]
MRGGDAIIKALMDKGVDTIFGYPGGTVIPFYDMLYDSDLRHILVRHEQCAAHAAEGYARASGKVGVCLATSGPGATNLVTGIANAYMDSSPLIAITGQVVSNLIGNDAFQEVDIMGITMPITKHSYQPKDANDIPSIINTSFEIASTGRNGPVLIDIPKEVQEQELDEYLLGTIPTPGYKPTTKGNDKQIAKAAKMLLEAERPFILAGGGTILSGASEELKKIAELIKAPIATTLMGKGIIDEKEDLSIGMLGMHGKQVANQNVNKSDCLLAIGCRFSDRTTGKLDEFMPNAKVIHIDIDPAEIGKNVHVDLPIVGDAKIVLNQLIKELEGSPSDKSAWLKSIVDFKKSTIPRVSYNDIPLKPQQVIKEIANSINEDTIVTTDVGIHQMWAAHFLDISKPRKFISSGGLGTMGFGMPASIGAKVACPDEAVLAIVGDGGFLMVSQELATIKEYDVPVVIAILNNRKLGMVYQWQNKMYDKRYSQTDMGNTPDFVKLAESYGINAERVEGLGETQNILPKALKDNEAMLLDITVEKDEFIPMFPPGGAITDILGEYKYESDVKNINLDEKELSKDSQSIEGGK